MEETLVYSISFLCLLLAFKFILQAIKKPKNLPPSPPSLPVIGHLHLLKIPVHRTLAHLSKKYGPIFSLKFGSRLVVVVSSPELVEECFTKNDVVLANRPDFTVSRALSYNHTTLGAAPYGDHWRKLRRVSALEILSSNRLNMSLGIRTEEINHLLQRLNRVSKNDFAKVELKTLFSELTLNITMRMVAGKRYYGDHITDIEEAKQFRQLIDELFEYTLASYPGDFLPILQWVDYKAYMAGKLVKRLDAFYQQLVDQHRRNNGRFENDSTMINQLISLQEQQPDYYTDDIIKGLIMTMILGGTDTSSVTMEWAMANLLNHPDVLKKAKEEIDAQVGSDHLIEESDLAKLPYLRCIISETLRLYPAGPLLLPHRSSADCTIGGYNVPGDTILFVNAWAIHRDAKLWEEVEKFKPERFENTESEAQKLMMAFGQGRRACPGVAMANRVLGMTLGSMIQCFEWNRIGAKEIDMAEGQGISMPKAEPLVGVCKARDIAHKVLS